MDALIGTVGWFPQEYAGQFYLFKGILAVVTTIMVIGHMMHTWRDVTTWGRRLRYFALLAFTALIAFASAEQIDEEVLVSYRNLGAVLVLLLTMVAMVVSIREDLRKS